MRVKAPRVETKESGIPGPIRISMSDSVLKMSKVKLDDKSELNEENLSYILEIRNTTSTHGDAWNQSCNFAELTRGEGKVHCDASLAFKKWFPFGFTFFYFFFTFESRRDLVRVEVFTFFTSVFTFHYKFKLSKRPQIIFLPILNFEINAKSFLCC